MIIKTTPQSKVLRPFQKTLKPKYSSILTEVQEYKAQRSKQLQKDWQIRSAEAFLHCIHRILDGRRNRDLAVEHSHVLETCSGKQ